MGTGGIRRRWLLACVLAEAIGMAASAVAARAAVGIAAACSWLALAVVVAGGLVEGAALGTLQGRVLATRWPALSRLRFGFLTLLVAGVGWAAASAPGVLGGDADAAAPPLALVLLGAMGIGAVMGPVLGAAQAAALRGVVVHPRRWLTANAAAWPLAMVVIFAGASTAGEHWSILVLAGYGLLTGACAGAALGAITGLWLGSLDGQPMANRVAVRLLESGHLDSGLVELAVRGRRTGRVLRFPVQYAVWGDDLVVVPRHSDRKSWWRNLEGAGVPVEVFHDGRWRPAHADLITAGDPGYESAAAAYRDRWHHSEPSVWDPVVVIRGLGSGIPTSSQGLESVGS